MLRYAIGDIERSGCRIRFLRSLVLHYDHGGATMTTHPVLAEPPEPKIGDILVRHWVPTNEALLAMFAGEQQKVKGSSTVSFTVPDSIEFDPWKNTVNIVSCLNVSAHTDMDFGRYSALWIMIADRHRIGVSNKMQSLASAVSRRPRGGRCEYLAVPGEIALIDVHRLHWVLKGNGVFAAMSIDFLELPTMAEVERSFVENLK